MQLNDHSSRGFPRLGTLLIVARSRAFTEPLVNHFSR